MKLIKPKFWSEKNIISYLLYPFSIITHLANFLKKISPKKKFDIKTICVGNIYTGGTGKYEGLSGEGGFFIGHTVTNWKDGAASGYATWNR